jgi:peptidoglycan hydrolase CwlO-like protein
MKMTSLTSDKEKEVQQLTKRTADLQQLLTFKDREVQRLNEMVESLKKRNREIDLEGKRELA